MPPRLGKNARGKTAPPIKKQEGATAAGSGSAATTATATTTENPQVLPPKDAALLAQVFQQYEDKKYAAAVKTADLVLKKYPLNAQTLCMKGLSTYNLGKREEGRELAKKGLAQDVKSHVCWHVSALIHRADREYEDALKCYIQGSRIEPNDLNIMRDKINLQLFLRKYSQAAESRANLLRLQPRLRYSWTALAVAHHLAGDLERASEMLDSYSELLDNIPSNDVEYSEVVLYKLEILLEANKAQAAQEVLDKEGKRIVDQEAKKQYSAAVLKKLGKTKAAELAYGDLLQDNSDNETYLNEYLLCRDVNVANIDDTTRQEAINVLSGLSDRFPRNRTIRRLVLDVATEETFRKRLSTYVVDGLNKGIPSLFSELKGLLQDPGKRDIMLHVLQSMRDSIESGKTIEGDDAESSSEESPTTYIWLLYLTAQVYLHLSQFQTALQTIDVALSHTPVLPELWMIKARAHKRSGDIYAAEDAMATARSLDGQDRFLNGKHVKYLLRIDAIEEAESTAGLFTRKDASSPLQDLTDMQCMWFLVEEAEAYKRKGDLGMALKRYHTIEKIFSEIYEDEFDFHAYCMRKFTLRACVNMARSNNFLRKHPAFIKAARGAIDIYLQLVATPYEKPSANGHAGSSASDGISEEERRKAEKKAKKAEAKAKAAAAASAAPTKAGQQPTEEELLAKEKEDEDPRGEKLWSTRTAMEDLKPFLVQLERLGEEVPEAQEVIAKVALRQKQYLRALKALRVLRKIAPASAALHECTIELASVLRSNDTQIAEPLRLFITEEFADLLPASVSLEAFNTDFLQKHPENAEVVLAAAKAHRRISPQSSQVQDLSMQLTRPENKASITVLKEATEFLQKDVKVGEDELKRFVDAAKERYPEATAFKSGEEVHAQKQAISDRRQKEREAGNEDVSS